MYIPATKGPGGYSAYDITYPYLITGNATFNRTIIQPSFANADWNTIKQVAQSGTASTFYSIGDEKTISIAGTDYLIRIIDFDHYNNNEIVCRLVNCLTTKYKMNNSATNSGSWGSSVMKTTCNTTIYNQLPSDLQAVIAETTIPYLYTYNSSTISISSGNKLFLPSEYEIFGVVSKAIAAEGTRFAWYSQHDTANDRTKKLGDSGNTTYWRLRSPRSDYGDSFCEVILDGSISGAGAYGSWGVSPVFCIR